MGERGNVVCYLGVVAVYEGLVDGDLVLRTLRCVSSVGMRIPDGFLSCV